MLQEDWKVVRESESVKKQTLTSKCKHCGSACGDAISLELYKGEAKPYYIPFCSVPHLIKFTCHLTQKSWRDTVDPSRLEKKEEGNNDTKKKKRKKRKAKSKQQQQQRY